MVTLTDHEGYVHITYTSYNSRNPVKELTLFKTDVKTRDLEANYAPLSEIDVRQENEHYRILKRGLRYESSLHLYIPHGTKNNLISIPIPCPKVRSGIKTRWNGDKGYWEKELKSGWCIA